MRNVAKLSVIYRKQKKKKEKKNHGTLLHDFLNLELCLSYCVGNGMERCAFPYPTHIFFIFFTPGVGRLVHTNNSTEQLLSHPWVLFPLVLAQLYT